jgi:hypothetical protein
VATFEFAKKLSIKVSISLSVILGLAIVKVGWGTGSEGFG